MQLCLRGKSNVHLIFNKNKAHGTPLPRELNAAKAHHVLAWQTQQLKDLPTAAVTQVGPL